MGGGGAATGLAGVGVGVFGVGSWGFKGSGELRRAYRGRPDPWVMREVAAGPAPDQAGVSRAHPALVS